METLPPNLSRHLTISLGECYQQLKVLFDTGANGGNYIGEDALAPFPHARREAVSHNVRLGDNQTLVNITERVYLYVHPKPLVGTLPDTDKVLTAFYVLPSLGAEANAQNVADLEVDSVLGMQDLQHLSFHLGQVDLTEFVPFVIDEDEGAIDFHEVVLERGRRVSESRFHALLSLQKLQGHCCYYK
jgi:hypothetical protein